MDIQKHTNVLMVSIHCLVYNHEPYLRQCLDGFVMQKTNFRFEAIVHDDASTDGSADIIREYAEKYPDIIKPILETKNQYSKKDDSLRRIMDEACKGKYIAYCEGDDYWIDENKLQKQVDWMEEHPDYSMCFHSVNVLSSIEKDTHLYDHLIEGDYNGNKIIEIWTVPTCSVLGRRELLAEVPRDRRFIYGDNVNFLTFAKRGKLYCFGEKMAVYRRVDSGVIYSNRKKDENVHFRNRINHYMVLKEHFPEYSDGIRKLIMPYIARNLFHNLSNLFKNSLYIFKFGVWSFFKVNFIFLLRKYLK